MLSQGGVVAASAFVPAVLVEKMRADALALEAAGEFACSGLSNSARGMAQAFGDADRIVRAIRPDLGGDIGTRREFGRHLDALRGEAGAALGRSLICAEQYYSIHRGGAFLPRHMDEKHEELKGDRGWSTSHRRSLSWLLYLSSEDVGGGAFRGYVRDLADGAPGVGTHEGNIQVGWLARGEGRLAVSASRVDADATDPVFLDAWVQASNPPSGLLVPSSRSSAQATAAETEAVTGDGEQMPPARVALDEPTAADGVPRVPDGVRVLSAGHPLSALYRVRPTGEREWLSAGFDARAYLTSPPDHQSGCSRSGDTGDGPERLGGAPTGGGEGEVGALWKWRQEALALQLPPALRDQFSSVEAVPHEGGAPVARAASRPQAVTSSLASPAPKAPAAPWPPYQRLLARTFGPITTLPSSCAQAPSRVVEISPVGGTLVIFDAVAVPHEVLLTLPLHRHRSPLTAHRSPLTAHRSPVTFHLSPSPSPLTTHLSPFTLTLPGAADDRGRACCHRRLVPRGATRLSRVV